MDNLTLFGFGFCLGMFVYAMLMLIMITSSLLKLKELTKEFLRENNLLNKFADYQKKDLQKDYIKHKYKPKRDCYG